MELIKRNFKKRIGWISLGNTMIISGFVSFSNHPEWGYWWAACGAVILIMASLIKSPKEKHD